MTDVDACPGVLDSEPLARLTAYTRALRLKTTGKV